MSDDEFGLQRFVLAQDEAGTYERAIEELRVARKQSHWMWFVFPQIAGLGRSPMAQSYALSGLPEARAYLAHPVLGPRLLECANVLSALGGVSAVDVLGAVDAQKLHSSMTLFALAAPEESVFTAVLERYFDGKPDEATITRV